MSIMGKKVNRKHKDRLFRFIFGDRREMLALYNALNGTDYTDQDGLVRGLFYFARLYKKYVKRHKMNLYSSHLNRLPSPRYIVFYNGREDEPDRKILRLSDAFLKPVREESGAEGQPESGTASVSGPGTLPQPCVEVTATMLNINLGRNRELMGHCRRLEEYAVFVERIRGRLDAGLELEEAVREAAASCLKEGILADVLSEHTEEVVEMFLTDYDFEEHMKMEREENYAYGHMDGKAEGKAEDICDMLEDVDILPDVWRRRILSENSIDTLKMWHKIARRAESLEEFLEESGLSGTKG